MSDCFPLYVYLLIAILVIGINIWIGLQDIPRQNAEAFWRN